MYEEKQTTKRKRLRWIQGGLIALAVLVPAIVMTFNIVKAQTVHCKVCMEFKGLSNCREVMGASRQECEQTGRDNACATIAHGMTDSIACSKSQALSIDFF